MNSILHLQSLFPWAVSGVVHGVALGVLAGLGVAHTQPAWESLVAPGQTVTLQAVFAPESERGSEEAVRFAIADRVATTELAPAPVGIERIESTNIEPMLTVELSEAIAATVVEAPSRTRKQTAELEEVVAAPEPAARPRNTVALEIDGETAVVMPSNAGATVEELPRQRSSNRPPAYPPDALRANREGNVVVRALVSADGHVINVKIESSSGTPSLDSAALGAVAAWHFTPARRGGVSVDYEVLLPVRFRL